MPPAAGSVFSLQTNLRKYLETWPTPGSTSTEAWPEYVPGAGKKWIKEPDGGGAGRALRLTASDEVAVKNLCHSERSVAE